MYNHNAQFSETRTTISRLDYCSAIRPIARAS